MIQVRNVNTNDLYTISEATLAYYKVVLYDKGEVDGGEYEIYSVEFVFNSERSLKFVVDAGLYESKEALELQLLECTRSFGGQILVSGVLG